jgi:hypothetical protein
MAENPVMLLIIFALPLKPSRSFSGLPHRPDQPHPPYQPYPTDCAYEGTIRRSGLRPSSSCIWYNIA